jgi:hypothetical protein
MAAKKVFLTVSLVALAVVAAVGLGLYVYPDKPYVVWTMLFLCWACYRLRMRAEALFNKQQRPQRAPVKLHERANDYSSESADPSSQK